MRPRLSRLTLQAVFTFLVLGLIGAQNRAEISPGSWAGAMILKAKDGTSLSGPIAVRLLKPGMGALLDIPEQSMFGYPLDEVSYSKSRLSFLFGALGPDEVLKFDGFYLANLNATRSAESLGDGGIVGTVSSPSWKGSFTLREVAPKIEAGESSLALRGAKEEDGDSPAPVLPGTLRLPRRVGQATPLAVLVAGSGPSDRNGNNFNVPGKTDSLKLLSEALALRGVATYRYDKRGSGEAYALERSSNSVGYARQARDLAAILGYFIDRQEYGRILVMSMNEGSWVAAQALDILGREGKAVDGFAVLGTSGEAPRTTLLKSLEGLDEVIRKEALAILAAIEEGRTYPEPSPILADFFSRDREDWIKEWIALKPDVDIGAANTPVLLVRGEADLQVGNEAFDLLAAARPGAATRLIPSMNYLLKRVTSEEENYASFSDPRFPIPEALADLLAAFAKAQPAP